MSLLVTHWCHIGQFWTLSRAFSALWILNSVSSFAYRRDGSNFQCYWLSHRNRSPFTQSFYRSRPTTLATTHDPGRFVDVCLPCSDFSGAQFYNNENIIRARLCAVVLWTVGLRAVGFGASNRHWRWLRSSLLQTKHLPTFGCRI